MRCLPYVQQRGVQTGAALAREHDLERRAVAPELRAGQARGCGRLGEQTAQASARRRGWWRSPSRGGPAVCLAAGSGLADVEGFRVGRDGQIAAPDEMHDLSSDECIKRLQRWDDEHDKQTCVSWWSRSPGRDRSMHGVFLMGGRAAIEAADHPDKLRRG